MIAQKDNLLGTIHSKRRQIFKFFNPYPLPSGKVLLIIVVVIVVVVSIVVVIIDIVWNIDNTIDYW